MRYFNAKPLRSPTTEIKKEDLDRLVRETLPDDQRPTIRVPAANVWVDPRVDG